jgi:hypothetical protein
MTPEQTVVLNEKHLEAIRRYLANNATQTKNKNYIMDVEDMRHLAIAVLAVQPEINFEWRGDECNVNDRIVGTAKKHGRRFKAVSMGCYIGHGTTKDARHAVEEAFKLWQRGIYKHTEG